jgi:hypothetical protein
MKRVVQDHPPSALWTTRNKGRWIECLVRLLPVGVDVEIIVDGAPLVGRTFETSEEAMEFVEREKVDWFAGGG